MHYQILIHNLDNDDDDDALWWRSATRKNTLPLFSSLTSVFLPNLLLTKMFISIINHLFGLVTPSPLHRILWKPERTRIRNKFKCQLTMQKLFYRHSSLLSPSFSLSGAKPLSRGVEWSMSGVSFSFHPQSPTHHPMNPTLATAIKQWSG